MTISNEKEFLAKHGFKSREAYNKKQQAIYKEKTNIVVKFFKIFLLTFTFTKNLLIKIIGFSFIAFIIVIMTYIGATFLITLITIPLTNKYNYWQIYGIFLNEDFIESGILRLFLFLIYLGIQLFIILLAWTSFINIWWYLFGFDKEDKNKNE